MASLAFVSDPGQPTARRWVLDLAGLSPGTSTFPEAAGFNQLPPRRIRLSAEALGQVLSYGTNDAGEGTVAGTVTARVPNATLGRSTSSSGFPAARGTRSRHLHRARSGSRATGAPRADPGQSAGVYGVASAGALLAEAVLAEGVLAGADVAASW